jgi:peroxiredoxin
LIRSVQVVVFVLIAALAVVAFAATARDGEQRRVCTPLCAMGPNYSGVNRLAPDFELPSTRGTKLKLSDYRGKVVILNFWTKTCKPCLEEMPALARLAKLLKGREKVVLLTISTDESVEDARATLASVLSEEPAFEVLVDAESQVVGGKFGTKLYPETWFIDPKGIIRARFDGPRQWDSSLVVSLAESLLLPGSCPIEYSDKGPSGPLELCEL